MYGKKQMLASLMPSLDGRRLEEVARELNLSVGTLSQYLAELGGGRGGAIRVTRVTNIIQVDREAWGEVSQINPHHMGDHHVLYTDVGRRKRLREDADYLGRFGIPNVEHGLSDGSFNLPDFLKRLWDEIDALSDSEEEELLARIAREGTAGGGERKA